jgi:hypothetical protein
LVLVAAELWQLRAEALPVAYGNDSSVHQQMVRFAAGEISHGRSPLSAWFPFLGLGSPQFTHYQPLGALITGLAGVIAGPDRAFAWSTWLLLATWPLSVYAAGRIFGMGRWAAACAAVVSPFLSSVSGVGYEQHAYLWNGYGVWAQLWAMWALPLSWAYSWRAVQQRRSRLPAVFWLAVTIALHFETGYLALAAVVVWAMVPLSRTGLRFRVVNAATVLALGLLASAWVLVPLVVSRNWASINEALQNTSLARGYGFRTLGYWLISGRMFDYGRVPVISLLVATGIVSSLRRLRSELLIQGLLGMAVTSFLLACGRTTFGPVAGVIPGSQDIFFRRFGMGVQLAGIYLAGIGAVALWRLGGRIIDKTVPEIVPLWRARPGLVSLRRCLVAGLGILLLTPAWYQIGSLDRANAADIQTQRAADATAGAQVTALVRQAEELGGGRIYAGMPSNWGAGFKVGLIPVFRYIESIDADEVGYTLRTASLMTNPEYELRDDAQDYALFGIRYLLVPASSAAPPGASFVARRGDYALWELPGDTYVQVVDVAGVVDENRGDIGRQAASFMRSPLLARGMYQAVDFDGTGARAGTAGQGSAQGAAGTLEWEQVDLAQGFVRAEVRASRGAVALLHASFDPGWQVTVDGTPQPAQMISPALVGVRVGPGTHIVTFRYTGFGYYGELFAIAVAALLAAALLDRRTRRAAGSEMSLRRPAGGGEGYQQVADLGGDAVERGLVVLRRSGDRLVHPGGDRGHVLLAQAAGGDGGRADPQTGRVERLARVERHRVVVRLDAGPVQRLGGRLAADALGRQVDQDQVVIGTAGDQVEAAGQQRVSQRLGVVHHLAGVVAEAGPCCFVQRDRDRGRGLIVRTALQAGKHGPVHGGRVLGVGHDHGAARTPERLVRRGGDHGGVPDRRRVGAAGDQPSDVGDVGDEQGARFGGDGREGREIDGPRDRGAAAEDDLGPFPEGQGADLVQVDPAGVAMHPVLDGVEPLAGRGDGPAVGEVAAHRQRHAHDRVARLGERQVDREVGRRARVRLHVGVVHAEQRLGPVPGDRLDRVDELLPLVVTAAGVALGILVGQHAALRLEDGYRDVVLGRDQPGLLVLPAGLILDELGDLRVIALDGRDGRVVHDWTSSHAGYTLRGVPGGSPPRG